MKLPPTSNTSATAPTSRCDGRSPDCRVRAGLRSRIVPGLLTLLLGAFAFLPICDLHFDCGCRFPGLGGHSHCDILTSGPPDCAWCDHAWAGYASLVFSSLAGLAALVAVPRNTHWTVATLLGFAAFFLAALVAGVLTSLAVGQPVLAGL